jgi:hypothetical protein
MSTVTVCSRSVIRTADVGETICMRQDVREDVRGNMFHIKQAYEKPRS